MVSVRYQDCTGCGDCVSVCPNDAIIIQNSVATIDHAVCDGCCACIDACPEGAIQSAEEEPGMIKTVVIAENLPTVQPQVDTRVEPRSLRSMVLPTISSVLLWTGKELLPRLADAAFRSLDSRKTNNIQNQRSSNTQRNNRRSPMNGRGQRRRQHQRRNRRS